MNLKGLTSQQAEESRRKNGANTLTQIPPDPLWKKILEGFKDPMIMILLVALAIQVVLWIMGKAEWYEPVCVLVAILLFFSFYTSNVGGVVYRYIIQINEVILMCYLLWRVETLSDLSSQQSLTMFAEEETATPDEVAKGVGLSSYVHDSITPLLQEHCIDAQLYLQHDLTLQQLAKVVGINRYYLSQYFSSQGTTYNAYVNGLRINHFVKLYHEYIANNRSFTTKQLANDSGYRSYSTFSLAFKQLMGQNVTTWMNDSAK